MVKKNNQDGTPIEFRIPAASLGGKGPRVPVPINQPNWVYKYTKNVKSKRGYSEWPVFKIILIIAATFGILIITDSTPKWPLWIVVITLGVIGILQIRSAAIKAANYTRN